MPPWSFQTGGGADSCILRYHGKLYGVEAQILSGAISGPGAAGRARVRRVAVGGAAGSSSGNLRIIGRMRGRTVRSCYPDLTVARTRRLEGRQRPRFRIWEHHHTVAAGRCHLWNKAPGGVGKTHPHRLNTKGPATVPAFCVSRASPRPPLRDLPRLRFAVIAFGQAQLASRI
jgi:hypothetical protein